MLAFFPTTATMVPLQPMQPQQLPSLLSSDGADVCITPSRWNSMMPKIWEMCFIQYLKPYKRVKLENMQILFYPAIAKVNDLKGVLFFWWN